MIYQLDLIAISTYFTKWLIRTKFAWPRSYKFIRFLLNRMYLTSCPFVWILMNDLHITPPRTRHWGLDKSCKIVQVRLYEFVRVSNLGKYIHTYIHTYINMNWSWDSIGYTKITNAEIKMYLKNYIYIYIYIYIRAVNRLKYLNRN